jgi:hypothetical protein
MKSRDLFKVRIHRFRIEQIYYKEAFLYQYFFTITFIISASIYDHKQQSIIIFFSEAYKARYL